MADEVKIDIDGDASGAEKAMAKLTKQYEALNQKLIDIGKTGKKSGTDIGGAFSGIKGEITTMLTGMVSVQTAISVGTKLTRDWVTEVERLKKNYTDVGKELVKTMTAAGDLKQGNQIERAMESIKGATKQQGTAAFGGITQGAPGLDLQRRLDIAGQIAPQAPTGVNLGQMGNIAGKVAELFPGMKADDVADMTVAMQQRGGEDLEKVGGDRFLSAVKKLQEEGVKPMRAVSMGFAALENNLKPTDALEAFQTMNKPVRSAADKTARMEAQKIVNIMGTGAEQEAFFNQAMTNNAAQQQLANLGNSPAGHQAAHEQRMATANQPFDLKEGAQFQQAQRAREFVMAKSRERGNNVFQRGFQNTVLYGAELATGSATGVLTTATSQRMGGFTPKDAAQFHDQEAALATAMAENNKLLAENNKLMQGQNRGAGNNKKNIDAHIE